MSLVFTLAAFSTIYFKFMCDALADRNQYNMLHMIGMSKLEIRRSVYSQITISFLLPGLIGIMHSFVAIRMLETILNESFALQFVSGAALFAELMYVFYVTISRSYANWASPSTA